MAGEKILLIDDDLGIINLCGEILKSKGYDFHYITDGEKVIQVLKENKFDLVLLDLQMPKMDGFEVLRNIRSFDENTPVVIITGFGTIENAVNAIKSGATDFMVKPFNLQEFLHIVERNLKIGTLSKEVSKLKMIETILELNKSIITLTNLENLLSQILELLYNLFHPEGVAVYLMEEIGGNFIFRKQIGWKNLVKVKTSYSRDEIMEMFKEKSVVIYRKEDFTEVNVSVKGKEKNIGIVSLYFEKERKISEGEINFLETFAIQAGIGMENAILFDIIQQSYLNAIRSLINSLEARDRYTKGHSEQVAYYALLIGKKMGLKSNELEILRNASYLHDLGKVGIKDNILLKPGPLTEIEKEIIRKHPLITVQILEPLNVKKEEMEACLYHHERVNGKGYPTGLKGEEIPFLARILAVADAYSAMISERPYRKSLTKQEAIEELRRYSGEQFDSKIVEVLVEIIEEIEDRREKIN